jgi:hypothetical protein
MSRLGTESAFEVLASRQALGTIVDCAIAAGDELTMPPASA